MSILMTLACLFEWWHSGKLVSIIEDVCGCNGEVLVSVNSEGHMVVTGPSGKSLHIANWKLVEE